MQDTCSLCCRSSFAGACLILEPEVKVRKAVMLPLYYLEFKELKCRVLVVKKVLTRALSFLPGNTSRRKYKKMIISQLLKSTLPFF
jgi:hypothetical protein